LPDPSEVHCGFVCEHKNVSLVIRQPILHADPLCVHLRRKLAGLGFEAGDALDEPLDVGKLESARCAGSALVSNGLCVQSA